MPCAELWGINEIYLDVFDGSSCVVPSMVQPLVSRQALSQCRVQYLAIDVVFRID